MSFDGSGNYAPPPPPVFPAVSGSQISSIYFNATINDIAAALTSVITRNGQSSPTANLPMAGFNFANLRAAAATGEAVTYEQLAGASGSTFTNFLQAGTGAVVRSAQTKLRERISVMDFGAIADGLSHPLSERFGTLAAAQVVYPHATALTNEIDWAASQAAINYAVTNRRCKVYFPPTVATAAYRITLPLTINGPVTLEGDNNFDTFIKGFGMLAGTPMVSINQAAVGALDVKKNIDIRDLSFTSDNELPDGLWINNIAYSTFENLYFEKVRDGIRIKGGNCYSNFFTNVNAYYLISRLGIWFNGFTGGGHWTFLNCTTSGSIGFFGDATSAINALHLIGHNFEQCTTNSLSWEGSWYGGGLYAPRTEGNNGVTDFLFNPQAGREICGITISAGCFSSDNSTNVCIEVAGAGIFSGFEFSGNYANNALAFVGFTGNGSAGEVSNNRLSLASIIPGMLAVLAPRVGITVKNNWNSTGKAPEYEGLSRGGASEGTFTLTDASGAGLALTGAQAKWSLTGQEMFWQVYLTMPVTGSGLSCVFGGLPFAVVVGTGGEVGRGGGLVGQNNINLSDMSLLQGQPGTQQFSLWHRGETDADASTARAAPAQATNAQLSGKYMYLSGTYTVAA